MKTNASERRLAENQVVFRSFNEKVQAQIDHVNQIAKEENEEPIKLDENTPLFFYCECSNENCKQRIKILPGIYNNIHKHRNTFTIAHGHEIARVEKVTSVEDEYYVVTKYKQPPATATTLHITRNNG